jgi:hypothetical protein
MNEVEIKRVRIQTAEPRGARYPGAVEEAHYTVQGNTVVLTNSRGVPIDKLQLSRKLTPGQDPHSIAAILLRQWKRPSRYDFNRVLHYQPLKY